MNNTLLTAPAPLTVNGRRVEDEGARAGVSNPGHEVATGFHHGDLQTQRAGGRRVVQAEPRRVEQHVQRLVPPVQVVLVNLVCTHTHVHEHGGSIGRASASRSNGLHD